MQIDKRTLRTIFFGICGCIVFYWILHETERVSSVFHWINNVLSPFVVGAGIAFVANVPMRKFEKMLGKIPHKGLRRFLAIVLTMISLMLILAVVFWLLIPQIMQTAESFISKLPGFFTEVQAKITQFLNDHPELMEFVYENTNWEQLNLPALIQKTIDMLGASVSAILASAFSAIGGVATGIMNLVISLVFALYCLAGKENLARQGRRLLYAFLPERVCDETVRILRLTNSTFSNFLSGQCVEVCILGCMFAISMAIFRMPYIPLVSVLVAVTAFIPVVGAFVGCILGALFILVDNPIQAVWFVAMFLVLQQIEGNIIYPRVVGTSIGLPSMWVLFAVAVGGELMGVGGMFLMIPMASVLYTLLRELTAKRLNLREVDADKLQAQPPEITSKFKERRRKKKEASEEEKDD